MNKHLSKLPKTISKPLSYYNLDQLINFIARRFGVYLDTIWGFRHNIENINNLQLQASKITSKSIEELDRLNIYYGNGEPPLKIENMNNNSLHRRTQAQFKINNRPGKINYTYAIYNCLTDIYNHWKIFRDKHGLKDKEFPIIEYIGHVRNRAQHELPNEIGLIKANTIIDCQKNLSNYEFPKFKEGNDIKLSEQDCIALILEIELQVKRIIL